MNTTYKNANVSFTYDTVDWLVLVVQGAFGYQSDDDSGLMLLGHRYYDSSTGRFISRDPVGDGSNWYVYCGNNPVSWTDRNGLDTEKIIEKARDIINNPEDWRNKWTDGKGNDLTDPCPFNPSHRPHPRYTDCGRFISEIIRALVDHEFPHVGTSKMINYLYADYVCNLIPFVDSKWMIFFDIRHARPGDFIIKHGHVAVVLDVQEGVQVPVHILGFASFLVSTFKYEIGEGSFGSHGPKVNNYSEAELRKKKMNTVFSPKY